MIYKRIDTRKKSSGLSATVIRYDENQDKAPTIVAQGKGQMATQIIELARKNNIPMQEDPMLIQNLIDMDLGENIPPQLYAVIAEILLMVEELEKEY